MGNTQEFVMSLFDKIRENQGDKHAAELQRHAHGILITLGNGDTTADDVTLVSELSDVFIKQVKQIAEEARKNAR